MASPASAANGPLNVANAAASGHGGPETCVIGPARTIGMALRSTAVLGKGRLPNGRKTLQTQTQRDNPLADRVAFVAQA